MLQADSSVAPGFAGPPERRQMTELGLYDVVRLRTPRAGIDTTILGAVVMVYDVVPAEYEVEFCDCEGATLALLTLRVDEIVKVETGSGEKGAGGRCVGLERGAMLCG
jgi:hypothetical protein